MRPHCEDAPCCGCCGPGTDDPAYAYDDSPDVELEYERYEAGLYDDDTE